VDPQTPTDEAAAVAGWKQWLRFARVGAKCVYYEGSLSADRYLRKNAKEVNARARAADAIGKEAWRAHEQGRVALVQRRLGVRRFAYVAIKLEA
jgi:hypothetical protein